MRIISATLRRHRKDLKEYFVLCGKTAVALLVLFQMSAVAVFSIPSEATGTVARYLTEHLRPQVAPYVLMTSQWQEWNLFAPDPLRQVRGYEVEAEDGLGWKTIAAVNPNSFPWWRHGTYAKLMTSMLVKERYDYDVFRERFLQFLCHDMGVAPGTMVRLRETMSVIPYTDVHQDKAWWDGQAAAADSSVTHTSTCTDSAL